MSPPRNPLPLPHTPQTLPRVKRSTSQNARNMSPATRLASCLQRTCITSSNYTQQLMTTSREYRHVCTLTTSPGKPSSHTLIQVALMTVSESIPTDSLYIPCRECNTPTFLIPSFITISPFVSLLYPLHLPFPVFAIVPPGYALT